MVASTGLLLAGLLGVCAVDEPGRVMVDRDAPERADGAGAAFKLEDARAYAPIVWLGHDDTHPMLPHPFAFDGVDNDNDGCLDVEDADEVRQDWHELLVKRHQGRPVPACEGSPPADCTDRSTDCWTTEPAPPARVLYSPRELYAGEASEEDLAGLTDPVGSLRRRKEKRSEGRTLVGPSGLRERLGGERIDIIQYWFYYPYDEGPNGHADDGEHVSVFIQSDGEGPLGSRVKGMVGAGHMPYNVNNVLVAGEDRSQALFPHRLPDHLPVLVELGKHASAPDRNCNGRFDIGFDANLYPEGAWGSRDVWAGNVGQALKIGDFESWFSYSRSLQGVLLEESWNPSQPDAYRDTCKGFGGPLAEFLRAGGAPEPPGASCTDCPRTYSLFPIPLLVELYRVLGEPAATERDVEAFLRKHQREFWAGDVSPRPPRVTREAFAAMRAWVRDTSPRREVWLHEAYRAPQDDFRPWLFRPFGVGLSSRADAGNWVSGFSLRFSQIRLPKWLPFGLGGSEAFHDSRLELYTHFDGVGNDPTLCGDTGLCLNDIGVDFFSGRSRITGTYFGLVWNRSYTASNFWQRLGLTAGVEFGVPSLPLPSFLRGIGRNTSITGMVGVSGQLFRLTSDDIDDPTQARTTSPLQVHVGLRLTFGAGPTRDPLSY